MKGNRKEWRVYVIELDNDPSHVYVGQTSKTNLEERLRQHNSGDAKQKSARVFIRGSRGILRPDLYALYKPRYTEGSSKTLEARVAEKLRKKGYRVEGGH